MRYIFLIFLLIVSVVGFSQAKKDTVPLAPTVHKTEKSKTDSVSKPKTQAELAASIVVVFRGMNQINALMVALDKSDAEHNSVVKPLFDIVNKQIDAQLPDSMRKAPGYPLKK